MIKDVVRKPGVLGEGEVVRQPAPGEARQTDIQQRQPRPSATASAITTR